MLSYQHIYHAGNLADVQKHALLAWTLAYLTRKDKPLSYIETHAGRGLYQLDAAEAVKTGEAEQGITRVLADHGLAADHPLHHALTETRNQHGGAAYPGSPLVAASLLRPGDALHFAELHPQENAALRAALRPWKAKVHQQDGFELAMSLAPPTPRRGLILIDPSYEIKTDYARIPGIIGQLHKKWNVGIIALWYPILKDGAHTQMLTALEAQGLPGALRHEVSFPPVRDGHRMIGSGMFVVNAPYGIEEEAARLSALFEGISRK
ncbi:23S rRNA (adenine(2030)-N(6))-methyltransferase RlmJ [Leisingera methylohalidivorans]|uniref:Ribosomal RNA large subunit methyltransferase J n=1 Tax=Leisingera methylohalidivorans DSM 14336 TaxID=999552 RepID=V9VRV7_9RHOB|nr:23S rRNA (adenine(2030)-N(6))-methyltransferase RlmJ [Leisingera methylohalidivorans]AHC99596.1 external DNA catabolism protein [Leisingera methylohalidivorans DSM 14336]